MGELPLAMDVHSLANSFMRLDILVPVMVLACVEVQPSLLDHIQAQQFKDVKLCKIRDKVL